MSVEIKHKEPAPATLPILEARLSQSGERDWCLIAREQGSGYPEVLIQVRRMGEILGVGTSPDDAREFAAAIIKLADQVDAR